VEAVRQAAVSLLRRREFDQVPIAEIARRAGVGIGTFYHFYPSKEALLLDLRGRLIGSSVDLLARGMSAPMSDGRAFVGRLEGLLLGWIRASGEHRGLERAIAAASYRSEAFAAEVLRQEAKARAAVATLLRAHAPLLRPMDPDVAAHVVYILVESVVTRAMRDPELAATPAAVAREAAKMVGRYLLPPARRTPGP
jgi:AcrR family transcriptional regulator